jgi:hypothetical protein
MKNVFSEILSLEGFCAKKRLSSESLQVAKTTKGFFLLIAYGSPVAVIKKELQGSTLQETLANIQSVNLCFGMPHQGDTDKAGRPSLPCLMESKSQWETIGLFEGH